MDRKRLLLALVLSVAVLAVYSFITNKYFPPPPPPVIEESVPTSPDSAPGTAKLETPAPTPTTKPTAAAPQTQAPVAEAPPRDLVVSTSYWNVTLTNRGAVATSWVLKSYSDNGKIKELIGSDGQPLQFVPQPLPDGLDAPLALHIPGQPDLAAQLNKAGYQVLVDDKPFDQNTLNIGAGEHHKITFMVTSGAATATKELTFTGDSLVMDASAKVTTSEGAKPVQLVVGPGFGDQSDKSSGSYSTPPQIVAYTADGSRQQMAGAKISESTTASHTYQWAGVIDHYFAMIAVPNQAVGITPANVQVKPDPNQAAHDYPLVAVPATDGVHIFVGPKDRILLAQVGEAYNKVNLGAVIDYGFFGAIIRPLIYPLSWAFTLFFGLFHNYGWAIITVTILINLALWPLRASSSKKMKQAAKHQPRMKELQDRMKKLKENPKKYERELQELQQEQLALMKEANPLGGCLPLVLQLPIFWSVYTYLGMSLDVRHAHWLGWIHDLSKPDPYKILPIVMCISMIASTKFTPQPANNDPAMKMQRVMMTWLMPIMLTYFFFLSAPSGLVLYWMVSNLVGVAMQLWINRQTGGPTTETGLVPSGGTPPTKAALPKGSKPKPGKEQTA